MRSGANPPSRLAPPAKIDAIGLEPDVKAITERLFTDSKELHFIPIVGTGGIGKTTLAQTIYHDPLIVGKFDIRAWVTVSQDYSFGDIFKNLLISMKEFVREETSGLSNHEMAEKVYQTLIGRRYLIVIDDMWSEKTWDEVRNYFPDRGDGSRIILTTRLEDVAARADSSKKFHEMKFLGDDDSWDLLKKEVFKGRSYPPTLEKIGRKIAKSCGGLPLAIVVIAGLLSEVSRTEADWEQIANNINLAITAEEEKYAAILSLSYTNLPHHLRHCFLYMGAFPEDYEIPVSNLVKLWVAEGFVQSTLTKSPEEVAEGFLMDLIKRNLVLVKKRKSNGGIKSCGVHDLLRDLCLVRSLEENFLLYFMGKFVLPEIFEDQLRISVSYSDNLLEIDGSTIQTIICYQRSKIGSLEKFRLLSILDMVKADLPNHVFELLHLKHVALSSPTVIPSSISSLRNLETLIVYPTKPCMVTLPDEIWKMSRLRHLISSSFHPLPRLDGETPPLENLHTLSLVTNFVCSERMVEMIPNVKKLGICYIEGKLDDEYHLENLQRLDKLEKLKMEICSDFSLRPSLNPVFPEALKKLTLSGWHHPWEDLSIVGSLPNLQVLKLRNYACDGSIWKTSEGEFEELEFLLIDECNLEEWLMDSSHFPKLKSLVLQRCPSLAEIPDDFGYIPTLELIEVDGRNKSLVESAKRIQNEQETEYENYSIQVRY
ncbi:putative late blight resistance protein homolog R1B-16 [Salvia miltiorrhiza]|uniref:putative late blight resistance protein homolog R1B-16 n=1 Tax=Salvia miltiorrhiza TaxID=226208 RepID=UPI0025ACA610|nr:putative late blight resistance protein homolog R1B-16 [Salvia miltiorrhiza]XP_057802575.1 putative late blight resistance protein homolog R1B-16 [Salvia miltiorrhiza]XP_057802576.1 putative late blight resistance protein homolog R1B-16 [Salvia miltiorrhiza]XP_057802577.1 putative late blight resistance protein homolog R1B-16 [Salvia miltiorrhiza]